MSKTHQNSDSAQSAIHLAVTKLAVEHRMLSRVATLLATPEQGQIDLAGLAEEVELIAMAHKKTTAAIARVSKALAVVSASTTNPSPNANDAEGEVI